MLSRGRSLRPPRLVLQTGIYTASQLVSRAIPFLLLPILTRYLTPAEYGIVAMFLLVAALAEPFVGLGLSGAISVRYFDSDIDLPRYLGTGMAVMAGAAVLVFATFAIFHDPLSQITLLPPGWLLLIVPLILARAIGMVPLTLLRVREKAAAFSFMQNSHTVGLFALVLLLVAGLGFGWEGRAAAEIVSWAIFAAIGAALMWRHGWFVIAFDKPYAAALLRFGGPLIPHLVGTVVIVQIDRLLLTNMVGVDKTGLYVVAVQLVLVIELVAMSFNNAFAPWLFKRLGDATPELKRRLVRYTYLAMAGIAALSLLATFVMPWLAEVFIDPRYADAAEFVPWLAIGFMFRGMYFLVTGYIFFAGQTAYLAVVTGITAAVNIALTYLLIQTNGAVGAAQATAVTFAIAFLLTWAASQRAYPMPWISAWLSDARGSTP